MGTRDDMCGMDVAQMEELGGFAEEIMIVGCAYKADDDIFYRVSDDPNEIYLFYKDAAIQGLLPTIPQCYVRREIIPAGQRERMITEAKLACVRQMRRDFDARFWQCFDVLAKIDATNNFRELFEGQRQALEGRYNREVLELFAVFLNDAIRRRFLSLEDYKYFTTWLAANYEKMVDDWMVKERYERTFYGLAYFMEPTTINYLVDTTPFNLFLKQQDLRLQNFKVTPIFYKTCQYKENAALPKIRKQFNEWLKEITRKWAVPYELEINSGEKRCPPFDTITFNKLSMPAQRTLQYAQKLWGLR